MFVSGRSAEYFGRLFPEIPRFKVKTPSLIAASPQGADFGRSSELGENRSDDFVVTNYSAIDGALSALHGNPDLVITDYEPVAATLAYASCCPLITIDNQSSFLGFRFPPIRSMHNNAERLRDEERCRLSFFFPKADERFALSFFRISYPADPRFAVTVIPPVIRASIRRSSEVNGNHFRRKIVVYLSPGKPTGAASAGIQTATELADIFASQSDLDFVIFSDRAGPSPASNVSIRPFDNDELPRELCTCDAVIATAGHTLLSEIVHLQKPVLAVPVDTFEQTYNARSIEMAGIGRAATVITADRLSQFVSEIPVFQHAYREQCARGFIDTRNGSLVLTEILCLKYGL
jgi:uncharacterized protein (TIGR00661 family)